MRPTLAIVAAGLFVVLAAAPAIAQPADSVDVFRAVGSILVDADGHAEGAVLLAKVDEAHGILSDVSSRASGRALFDAVSVDGFDALGKAEGVGSSALRLRGDVATILAHDDITSAIQVLPTAAGTVHFQLAHGLVAAVQDAHHGIVDINDEAGYYVGSVVAVGADGPKSLGERVTVAMSDVQARASAGSDIVFLARAPGADEAFARAIVDALDKGQLASQFVTEMDGSAVVSSDAAYGLVSRAATSAASVGEVATSVHSSGDASQLVAYDLAYETLPAASAADVAVYADGALAQRASSAQEVRALANHGIASFFARVDDGRALVLASTPDFGSVSDHALWLVAGGAGAATQAQAQAEGRGALLSGVLGAIDLHASGKLTGEFVTAYAAKGSAAIQGFTPLASRVELFQTVSFVGDQGGATRVLDAHHVLVAGDHGNITLVDDAYASLVMEAKKNADARLDLAHGIVARLLARDVVALDGPDGFHALAILQSARDDARFSFNTQRLSASLRPGDKVLVESALETFGSEAAIASAIADGKIGATVLAGAHDAITLEHASDADALVSKVSPGEISIDYAAGAARSLVLDARPGSALAAKAESDIRVLVDGAPAASLASPEEVLQAHGAAYFAQTAADGALRVVMHLPSDHAKVLVLSTLDEAAKAAQGTDAFGAFRVFDNGAAVGDFVTMQVDQQAGAIGQLTMVARSQPLFASLVAGRSPFTGAGVDGATTILLENKEARTLVTDTSNALIEVSAKQDADAAFRLADGLHAEPRGSGVLEIVDAAHEDVGTLVLAQAVSGARLATDGGDAIMAHLPKGSSLIFRAHAGVERELSDAQRAMIARAISTGAVAGQVMVQTSAAASFAPLASSSLGDVKVAATESLGQVTSAVTSEYGDVKMATSATRDRVEVTLSSASAIGRTILISLDPATVAGLAKGQAEILLDGVPVHEASSMTDVLDATDDGGAAESLVLAGEAGTQVLVSVPHFSVHTVTIAQTHPSSGPAFSVYLAVILGLLVAAETVYLVIARRN